MVIYANSYLFAIPDIGQGKEYFCVFRPWDGGKGDYNLQCQSVEGLISGIKQSRVNFEREFEPVSGLPGVLQDKPFMKNARPFSIDELSKVREALGLESNGPITF